MPVRDKRTLTTEPGLLEEEPEPGVDPVGATGGTAADSGDPDFPGLDSGEDETLEIYRLRCPECDRPIALFGDEERFPQHALVRTAWNPFASVVCPGSGQLVDETADLEEDPGFDAGPDLETLLALPPELDWRMQPFSHVGGPASRPMRLAVPRLRKPLALRPAWRGR
jgi:hypothetical protein